MTQPQLDPLNLVVRNMEATLARVYDRGWSEPSGAALETAAPSGARRARKSIDCTAIWPPEI